MVQLTIDDAISEARAGLEKAVTNANRTHEGWSDAAYELFKEYLAVTGRGNSFQVEQFRNYCKDILPDPPSKRAYGVVVTRGKKDGLIESLGFKHKESRESHSTPAILWKVL